MDRHGTSVVDGWAQTVAAPPGQILPDEEVLLAQESADLGRNLETQDPDWYGRSLRRIADLPLQGRVLAFDPVGEPGPALRFPVVVEAGHYPAFVLQGDADDLMMVRLGGGRPVAWRGLRSADGSELSFPIEAGRFGMSDERTYQALHDDEGVRKAARSLVSAAGGSGPLPGHPRLGLAVAHSGVDQPAWGYVGLSATGAAAAVAVVLMTDCVYTYRPESDDTLAIECCAALVESQQDDDRDDDEIRSYLWPSVQADLARRGRLSGVSRHHVYEILEAGGERSWP